MRIFALLLCMLLSMLSVPAGAAENQSVGAHKLQLLKQLESDGYLSSKLAQEAREKYVTPEDLKTLPSPVAASAAEPSLWERYVSWMNFFKLLGVILLLVAFSGWIARLGAAMLFIIVSVPKEVYQTVLLGISVTLTVAPHAVWASEAFYLALFGAFANLMVLAWTVESHPKLKDLLKRIFSLGIPPLCVMSFWGTLYFAALALAYQSQIFGFFSAVCLSGMFSFVVYYRPGVLTLDFKESALGAVVFGHLLVVGAYAVAKVTGTLPAQAELFAVGLQYYCTIAMGVGFLVGASPFAKRPAGYVLLFVAVLMLAVFAYFMFDLKVIASILCVFAVLLALEWIGYVGYRAGFLAGTFALGAALYGCALLLEKYQHLVILRMT